MKPNVAPVVRTDELNGLNWQVQVDPVTLTMLTLPPTLPVLELLVEDLDELPPHAATSNDAMINNESHLKRFIDTLRSPSTIASSTLAQNVCGSHLAPPRHAPRSGYLANA
jgi:hypothetical protein